MEPQYVVAIMGALIGAFTGIFVALLTHGYQSRLAYRKWVRAREDDVVKDLRLAIAELATQLAVGAHRIGWFTWKAATDPAEFSHEDIVDYTREMQLLFPEIVGARVRLAALDRELHDQMTPLIKRLYTLDGKIGSHAAKFGSSPQESLEALAQCHPVQQQLAGDILDGATALIGLEQVREQLAQSKT